MSNIVTTLFGIVVVGCALYLVETYVPMAAPVKTILRVLVVLLIVFWLLRIAGLV